MFQDRRDSWIGKVLALSFALSLLGSGGLLHLTHHLPGDEETAVPWECFQCKIADSAGEHEGSAVCIGPAFTCEFLISWDEAEGPFIEGLDPASPRAPPVTV